MSIIIMIIGIIYIIGFVWTWKNLDDIKKSQKIIIIGIGTIIIYLITLLLFQFSKNGITYPKMEFEKNIKQVITLLFTGINVLGFLPSIVNNLYKLKNKEITQGKFTKNIILLLSIFIIASIVEVNYMKDTQEGIMKIYKVRNQQ